MAAALPTAIAAEAADQVSVRPRGAAHARLLLIAMGLFVTAAWLIAHRYSGLVHDATVYTLMALERAHPDTLSHDVFLRFGSQDQYTLFGPLFASVIRLLDLEPAAALLTLLSHCALFGCAWLLARRYMSASLSLLATGLLVVLPSAYGSSNFFHYTENFLTPRLLAEALVLGAIAAQLARRHTWTALCILAALLLHPVMGAAGIAMLAFTFVALPRPKLALGCGAAALAVSLVMVLLSLAPFTAFGNGDAKWLQIVRRTSPYLFLSGWSVDDWIRLAVFFAALTLGMLTAATSQQRTLYIGALLTALAGLALTAIYCDAFHIVLATQAQPWRWVWVTQAVTVLMIPLIARDCWRLGPLTRAALILLVSAWLFQDDTTRLAAASLAVVCAVARRAPVAARYGRLIFFGACSMLLLSIAINVGEKYAFINATRSGDLPLLAQVTGDGILLVAALLVAWWTCERATTATHTASLALLGAVACGLCGWYAWGAWSNFAYTPQLREKFSSWRREMPSQAEVQWPGIPVGAWYLLDRPNYWSSFQGVGAVFSKPKALELNRRTVAMWLITPAPPQTKEPASAESDVIQNGVALPAPERLILDIASLRNACKDPALSYVVSWTHVATTTIPPVIPDSQKPNKRMYLYRCADFRN